MYIQALYKASSFNQCSHKIVYEAKFKTERINKFLFIYVLQQP